MDEIIYKMAKKLLASFLVMTLCILLLDAFAQSSEEKRWLKRTTNAEDLYNKGKYNRAYRKVKRLLRRQDKGRYASHLKAGTAALNAKYLNAMGFGVKAVGVEQKYLELIGIKDLEGDFSESEFAQRLYIVNFYLSLKNTQKANAYLDNLEMHYTPSLDRDSSFYLDLISLRALSFRLSGRYEQAITKYEEALSLAERKKQSHFTLYSSSGEKEEVRQQVQHVDLNKHLYSLLMVDYGETIMNYGNDHKAKKIFEENEKELMKFISKRHSPYIRNTFNLIYTNYLLGNYDAKKAASKQKKEIRRYANRTRYGLPNEFYFKQVERQLEMLTEAYKFGAIENITSRYAREALKGFGRGNYHFAHGYKLKVLSDIASGKYLSAERKMRLVEDDAGNLPALHVKRLEWNKTHALISRALFNFELEQKYLLENISIARANYGNNAPETHKYNLDLADYATRRSNDFARAGELYDQGISRYLNAIHPHHEDYFKYYENYVYFLLETDKYDSALSVSQNLVEAAVSKMGENSVLGASMNALLAEVQTARGDYTVAQLTFEEAINQIEEVRATDKFEYVKMLFGLGDIYNINGQTDDAEKTFRKAYRYSKRLSGIEKISEFESPEDLAATYLNSGNYSSAGRVLDRVIKNKTKNYGSDDYKLYNAYLLKGKLNYTLGEYTVAERFANQAKNTLTGTGFETSGAKGLEVSILLGDIYTGMGNYGKAEEAYETALNGWRMKFGKEHIKNAEILTKKSKLFLKSDRDRIEVLNLLDNAATIIQNAVTDKHPQYAEAIELKGKVLIDQEKFDEALNLLNKAAKIYEESYGSKHLKSADNSATIGDLYYRKGDFKVAEKKYLKSVKSYKNIFDEFHPKYVGTLTKVAQANYAGGNYKDAVKYLDEATEIYLTFIQRFFPALSEKEKAEFWNSIRPAFEMYNSLGVNYGKEDRKVVRKMYGNQMATKALLLSSSMKVKQTILQSGNDALIEEYNTLQDLRALFVSALSMPKSERELNDLNTASIEKEINALEKSLSEKTGVFDESTTEVPSWRKVRRVLKDDEAVVEMVRFNYFDTKFTDSVIYAALVITPNTSRRPDLVVLDNGSLLEDRYFKYYTNTVKFKTKDKFSYKFFWEPLEGALAGAKKVYLSPDGVYNQLNPETFDNGNNYLIDEYEFVQIYNSKDLVKEKDDAPLRKRSVDAVLFGNPDFSYKRQGMDLTASNEARKNPPNKVSSVAPLPGAEEEVQKLRDFLENNSWVTEKYLNAKATEEQVKAVRSPKVLHIATHGFFVDEETLSGKDNTNEIVEEYKNPLLKSGLLFTGSEQLLKTENLFEFNREEGILTAYEAMSLSLDNTELVVLSACETGRGEIQAGEGVFGLQRAFKVAGADAIIMTLFKVDDEATQKLMMYFYRFWLESNDKRDAFIKAKQKIKDEYDAPIFWGSFIMIGGE